jgi:hypothetical protein
MLWFHSSYRLVGCSHSGRRKKEFVRHIFVFFFFFWSNIHNTLNTKGCISDDLNEMMDAGLIFHMTNEQK